MKIIITSPSLDVATNVSGVSAVTNFIIKLNPGQQYTHFEIGKKDAQSRGIGWLAGLLVMYCKWFVLMCTTRSLIHFNFPVDKRSVIRDVPLIMMGKLFFKRMVIHLHGGELLLSDNVPRWLIFMIYIALSGNRPIICLSKEERDFVAKRFKCKNAISLPNAIDLTDAAEFKRTLGKDEIPTILFLGRIHPDKGLAYIYPALQLLMGQKLNFKFVLAGKGPVEEEYKVKFTELLGNKFDFRGIVSGDTKTKAFEDCNIFLLPSFWEGLPIALLEAMSFGLVPVTTDVGAMKVVVQPGVNGMIVDLRSASSIAEAIKKLSENMNEMHRLGENAKQLVFTGYNPKTYIDTLNTIYQYE